MKPSSLHPSSRLERGIRNRRVNAEAPFWLASFWLDFHPLSSINSFYILLKHVIHSLLYWEITRVNATHLKSPSWRSFRVVLMRAAKREVWLGYTPASNAVGGNTATVPHEIGQTIVFHTARETVHKLKGRTWERNRQYSSKQKGKPGSCYSGLEVS